MSSFALRVPRAGVLGLLTMVGCFLGGPGRAQEKALTPPRSAYVNMEALFQGYYETVRSNEALSKQKDLYVQRANELAGQLDALKKARDANREKSLNIALTDEVRMQSRKEAEEKDLQARDKDKELREFVQSKDRDLGMKHRELRDEIVKKLTEFVRTYAEKEQFETVTDISGRTLNGISVMVYYPKDKDITDNVLTELNKGHESEIPESAEAGTAKEGAAAAEPAKTPEAKPVPVEPAKPAPEPVKAPEVKPPEPAKTPETTAVAAQDTPAVAEAVKPAEAKPAPVEPAKPAPVEPAKPAPVESAKPAPEPVKVPEVKPPEPAKAPEVHPAVPAEVAKPVVAKPVVAPAPVRETTAPVKNSPVVRAKIVKPVPAAQVAVKPGNATPAKTASATVVPAKRHGFFSFRWLVFWRKSTEPAPPEVNEVISVPSATAAGQ